MRKFRIWDKNNKEMITPDDMGLSKYQIALTMNGNIVVYHKLFKNIPQIMDNVEVNFYTGVMDINGKEICENDICIHRRGDEILRYVKIVYSLGKFVGCNLEYNDSKAHLGHLLQGECTLEVVNNIYEDEIEDNEIIKRIDKIVLDDEFRLKGITLEEFKKRRREGVLYGI
ncbi:YopX family protein [Romboutsia sp. 1001285H_161024_C4]|uniref:YopX family protein n=1 Tax=Romboutsia sp. 1001285H_161024_C4 TaxID=2787109 RepID=UPI001898C0FA|nr:YopX family protein [Romboutsia sp. 1001285H_161024_C4]